MFLIRVGPRPRSLRPSLRPPTREMPKILRQNLIHLKKKFRDIGKKFVFIIFFYF